jgi:hypothetical protein
LPGGTEEDHESLSEESSCPRWDLNWAPPGYKFERYRYSRAGYFGRSVLVAQRLNQGISSTGVCVRLSRVYRKVNPPKTNLDNFNLFRIWSSELQHRIIWQENRKRMRWAACKHTWGGKKSLGDRDIDETSLRKWYITHSLNGYVHISNIAVEWWNSWFVFGWFWIWILAFR